MALITDEDTISILVAELFEVELRPRRSLTASPPISEATVSAPAPAAYSQQT